MVVTKKRVRESDAGLCEYGLWDIVQREASDHSQGFEDNNLGSSPGMLGQ